MDAHFYVPDAAKPRHRQLKRLILASRDMQRAKSALDAAKELKDDDAIRTHLIAAAVVYYARSFCSGRNWSRISSKWEKFEDAALADLHRFVCAWRDAAVAHNDDELHDVEFIPKGSKISFAGPNGKEVELQVASHGEFYRGPKFPPAAVMPFIALCSHQHERIATDVAREKDALFDEFIKPAKKG